MNRMEYYSWIFLGNRKSFTPKKQLAPEMQISINRSCHPDILQHHWQILAATATLTLASFLALARLKFHKDPRSSKKQLQDHPTAKLRRKTSLQDFKYLQVKQGGRTPWQPRAFKTVSACHANDFEPVEQHGGQRVRGRTKLYMLGGLSTYISSLACWCLNIDQSEKTWERNTFC